MINAVGRDIPEEILKATGKEVFQGVHHFDGHVYKKHGPEVECVINSNVIPFTEMVMEADCHTIFNATFYKNIMAYCITLIFFISSVF